MDKNKIEQFSQSYDDKNNDNLKLIMEEYIRDNVSSLDVLYNKDSGFKQEEITKIFAKFSKDFNLNERIKPPVSTPVKYDGDKLVNNYDTSTIFPIFNDVIEDLCR